jgi:hypothetical protein
MVILSTRDTGFLEPDHSENTSSKSSSFVAYVTVGAITYPRILFPEPLLRNGHSAAAYLAVVAQQWTCM